MLLWPVKIFNVETRLKREKVIELLKEKTDQEWKGIYWGKKFYKRFWGKIGERGFRIRPVVPYWNISPVEILGDIDDSSEESTNIKIKLRCPYFRIVGPLAILAIILFFLNFGISGEMYVFLSSSVIILLSAYLLVNIPFQIQSTWSMKHLTEQISGRIYKIK